MNIFIIRVVVRLAEPEESDAMPAAPAAYPHHAKQQFSHFILDSILSL